MVTGKQGMIVRVFTALTLVIAAVLVGRASVANSARRARPTAALAMAPWDARAQAAEAERLLTVDGGRNAAARSRAAALARAAISRDPTSVPALVTLGLVEEVAGRRARAQRIFALSDRLSRRDLRTRIWLIEKAVARDDVSGALEQYDIALRTSRVARTTLFPILAAAISDAMVRSEVARVLLRRPSWAGDFVHQAAAASPDPLAGSALITQLRRGGMPIYAESETELLRRLVAAGRYDRAWGHYAAMDPGARRGGLRAADFRQRPEAATPFDWTVVSEGGVSAALPDPRGAGLDVQASPGAGGVVARQTALLAPGRYRLAGRTRGLPSGAVSPLHWAVTCPDGRAVGRVPIRGAGDRPAVFAGEMEVPAGCPAALVSLVAEPNDSAEGVSVTVERVEITRA